MQRGRDDVTYYDHVQKSCPSARQYGTYHSRRSFMRSYRDIGRPKHFHSPLLPSSFFPSRERERREERIFVLYTTLRKSNLLCTVPFFYLKRVCKSYDATVGCPKCKVRSDSDGIGLCVRALRVSYFCRVYRTPPRPYVNVRRP